MFCRVAVNYPIKNAGLTYQVPPGVDLRVGDMVDVPLGKRTELGCIIEMDVSAPEIATKPIQAKREDYPPLRDVDLRLFQWMSDYYHYGLGQLIADCLPATKKRPRPLSKETGEGIPFEHEATPAQAAVITALRQSHGQFHRHLIHGVTGAGKTLIYQEAILSALAQGKSVLYLLPEINLTPQFVDTFRKHVWANVYTYHSEITASEKYLIWKEALTSGPKLFIGVRSAVFLPVNELGLIIVDEEHDSSFKQEDRCAYNARDVAVKKAQLEGCPVVMGSATPSMETWYSHKRGGPGVFYHQLPARVGSGSLPRMKFIDTRRPVKPSAELTLESTWPLAEETVQVIGEAMAQGEQALVFINRLGYANYIQCRACGHQFHCPNCSVTLRYFRQRNVLSCQHCEYQEPMPVSCPQCFCLTLQQKGFGTERVQDELVKLLPNCRIERFDRDEIKTFTALKEKLGRFHSGEIDLFVGTQMLSKGHNFRRVKRVIMLGIDNQLNYPDFRASERVWQTMVQLAGRAGRYSPDGVVVVQTSNPESPLFEVISRQALDEFYEQELPIRELCECPPYFRLAALYFSGRFQEKLIPHMTRVVEPLLQGLVTKHFTEVRVLGPRPATVEKKANQYTWTVLLKCKEANRLHNCLNSFLLNWKSESGISLKIDVDPQHLG